MSMIGRVYRMPRSDGDWRVVCRWKGTQCPRNVLLERVRQPGHFRAHWEPVDPPELVVRPFRGLRRVR